MTEDRIYTACLIVIGNEVLSGRTRDANLQYLGRELNAIGVRLAEARVIPDDTAVIVTTVNDARARFDYVFTTGGIGPTHDDITSAAVAAAFGVPLERNPEAEARLRRHYEDKDLNAARLTMADIPRGADLIDNPVSQAPGFRLENVYVMAGVPRIAQAMFDGIRHTLKGGAPMRSMSRVAFVVEGRLAEPLAAIQAEAPGVDIGSYPFFRDGRLGTSVVARGTDADALAAVMTQVEAAMRALGGEPLDDETNGSHL